MPPLRILELSGAPYEMGVQHGRAYRDAIRDLSAERTALSCEPTWTGRSLPRNQVMELAEACLEHHYAYAPEIMEQIEGIAAATDLTPAELVIASGFTDFTDVIYNALERPPRMPVFGSECTAFMASGQTTADGQALIGQTWDMHATATPHVILLRARPRNEPAFLAFTLTGCVAMIGMNEAGIAVGINNLTMRDGEPGVTWPFVCRKILSRTTLDDAIACITSAKLAGGHNYLLMDSSGRGVNVEATASACHVETLDDVLAHTNLCLNPMTRAAERPQTDDLIDDSSVRRDRALSLLGQQPITPEWLMEITRSREDGAYSICSISEAPYYSETCGAVVMRPGGGDFWGVWGLPTENAYEHFRI